MSDYWRGFATPFVALIAMAVLLMLAGAAAELLRRRGFSLELRVDRNVETISAVTLRRSVVWRERRLWRLPVFVGRWERLKLQVGPDPPLLVTRWIGIGSPDGRSVMVFHLRVVPS